MPIQFACEACNKLLRVPDGSGGLSCECPACRTLLEIPDPAGLPGGQAAHGSTIGSDKLRIRCPRCSHELVCSAELLGSRGQCKRCQSIFTISEEKPTTTSPSAESAGWIFSCPDCDQLFEGKEEMRGRKGKCHACGKVFRIELRKAQEPFPTQTSLPSPDLPVPRPLPAARTPQSSQSTQAAAASGSPSFKATCPACRGAMQLSASAAGRTTACPHCQRLFVLPGPSAPKSPAAAMGLAIGSAQPMSNHPAPRQNVPAPSAPSGPAAASPSAASTNPWADLGDFSGQAVHSYTNSAASWTAGGAARTTSFGRLPSGREPSMYVLPGVFITIFGCLELVGLFLYLGSLWVNLGETMREGSPEWQGAVVFLAVLGVMLLVLTSLQILGGIAMIRRRGLAMARTAAVIACLPCGYCVLLNMPFGIWGAVVCMSGAASRDFRD